MLEDILNVLFHLVAIVFIVVVILLALRYLGQIATGINGILEVLKKGR